MTDKNSGQQPVKTKEEILSKLMGIPEYRLSDDSGEYPLKSAALKAMEEYASQFREGQQSAGVWVKASERVPEGFKKMYFIRNVETKSGGMVYWSDLVKMDDLENIEWLDESPVASKEQSEGEKKYYEGLTRRFGRTQPYQYTGDKCVPGCKNFSHYETKHHPDCPFYPGSLSEKYDKIDASKEQGEEIDITEESLTVGNETANKIFAELDKEFRKDPIFDTLRNEQRKRRMELEKENEELKEKIEKLKKLVEVNWFEANDTGGFVAPAGLKRRWEAYKKGYNL